MSERVMSERSTEQIRELLDSLYREDSGRILATLIRLLGDFDLAEEGGTVSLPHAKRLLLFFLFLFCLRPKFRKRQQNSVANLTQ